MAETILLFCTAPEEMVLGVEKTLLQDGKKIVYVGSQTSPFSSRFTFVSWGAGGFGWQNIPALWQKLRSQQATESHVVVNSHQAEGYHLLQGFACLITNSVTCHPPDGKQYKQMGSAFQFLLQPVGRLSRMALTAFAPFGFIMQNEIRKQAKQAGKANSKQQKKIVATTIKEVETSPKVSIVIRTFNEERFLKKTVDMILKQHSADIEIIIIDSGSTDKTIAIAKELPVRIFAIPKHQFSFGGTLNLGAKLARGEVVVNLSAHAVPVDEYWLEQLIKPLEWQGVVASHGKEVPMQGNCSLQEWNLLESSFNNRAEVKDSGSHFSNANSAIVKDALLTFPFNEKLDWAEDQHWMADMVSKNFKVAYVPTAAVYHSHNLTAMQLAVRRYRFQKAFFEEIFPDKKEQFIRGDITLFPSRVISFYRFLIYKRAWRAMPAAIYAICLEYFAMQAGKAAYTDSKNAV